MTYLPVFGDRGNWLHLPLGAQALLGGLLLLLMLQFALWWSSSASEGPARQSDGGLLAVFQFSALGLLLILPLLLGALSMGSTYVGSSYELNEVLGSDQLTVLNAALLHAQPDVYPIEIDPFGSFRRGGRFDPSYSLYGSGISLKAGLVLLCQLLLLSLGLWSACAVLCAAAARRPRSARTRPVSFDRPEDFQL